MTLYKSIIGFFSLTLVCWGLSLPGQAQAQTASVAPDTMQAPAAFVPRVSYGLNAGAGFSNLGSVSYLEPSVKYRVSPRVHVFSSLTMLQTWGGPMFRASTREGASATMMAATPARQYLLHVGGTYAMTEKLLLSGSVWKDLNPSLNNRYNSNPFTYGHYPSQGFQFKAHYQVAPNVTVSGGIRYGNGGNNYGYGDYYGGGFNSPWGY
ncbi:hypothetical protein [Rufibacter radiotolerans]|uniref:hypothetical protein n=1 Tax=Rufibacter radiotolerans TaxID=1379910 RepID=UPI0012E2CFAF|nr:hypothetical protein [Rufibacter radiotolerans]